jgi:hypothetical protein
MVSHISATSGGGGLGEGNVNNWGIERCSVLCNENGVFVDGGDVNAGMGLLINAMSNRRWGINDSSFLGNTWVACHADLNGNTLAFQPGGLSSTCTYLGKSYYVQHGQEAGASTNAPSGTTADNTWWGYRLTGVAAGAVAWTSGLTWKEGGAYSTDSSGNVYSIFVGCYSEASNGTSLMVYPTVVIGGIHAAGVNGTASVWSNSIGCTTLSTPLSVAADYRVNNVQVIGPQSPGWTADTGTADRTAHATYAAGTTLTFSAGYVQAEHTAMATRLAAVEAALQASTRAQKALKDDLLVHGLFGA